jgi:signal transduction histidine kinase
VSTPEPRRRRTLELLELEAAERRARLVVEDVPLPADRLKRQRIVVAVATALLAGAFAARLAVHDPAALLANFYTIPIAILAIEFGLRGGLVGASVGFALVVAWGEIKNLEVGALGYTSRAAVFLVVGVLVGRFSERLRADVLARQRAQRSLSLYASELERANARLAQSVLRLEAFAQIARQVGGETDLSRVLQLILRHGREIIEARSLLVFLREGEELVLAAAGSEQDEPAEPIRMPVEGSLPGSVVTTGAARLIAPGARELRELGAPAQAAVLVPLTFHGQPLGVLAALDPPAGDRGFSEGDAELLDAVGASAATAVMTAKSVARSLLRSSIDASEQARRRWARELHDETLQGIGGIALLLSSALATGDDGALRRAVEQAVDQTAAEVRTLRGLIAELRPAALDDLGLGPAIETLAERSAASSGFAVRTELELPPDGAERLPAETESTVYRLVQEALTNVVKHAEAGEVVVRLAQRNGSVEVIVRDDGRGFDPEQPSEGFGLVGMRERVALAGGSLRVSSRAGGPTTIEALVPS